MKYMKSSCVALITYFRSFSLPAAHHKWSCVMAGVIRKLKQRVWEKQYLFLYTVVNLHFDRDNRSHRLSLQWQKHYLFIFFFVFSWEGILSVLCEFDHHQRKKMGFVSKAIFLTAPLFRTSKPFNETSEIRSFQLKAWSVVGQVWGLVLHQWQSLRYSMSRTNLSHSDGRTE